MTQHPSDSLLSSYYKTMDGRHDKLRTELLNSLYDTQVVALANRPSVVPAWLASFRFVSTALVLIVAGLLIFASRWSTHSAYGLENLAERLAAIRSLHLKGWMYETITSDDGEEKVEKFPIELYVRRPNTIGFRTYSFSFPEGGEPTTVSSGFRANNGEQAIYVSHNERQATITRSTVDDFNTELVVEAFVQSSMAEKFLLGPPEYYRKVRSVRIEDVPCDMYEYEQKNVQPSGRHRIWLNRLTGIPVKSERTQIDESGVERIRTTEVMQVDVEPPASLFSFKAPEGYEVINVDTQDAATPDTNLQPFGQGGSGTTWLASWHCFNIGDRSVLACWRQYNVTDGEKEYFARQPEFALHQGDEIRKCREHTISTNKTKDSHWRWSLISPDDSATIGQCTLRIKVADERTRTSQELKPLRFPRERLHEILAEAQRRTLPDESRQELFTMEDLEAIE